MRRILFIVSVLFCVWACEDEIENPSLFISPVDYLQKVDTGDIVRFSISASAYKSNALKNFKISYSTETETSKILIDSSLNGSSKLSYDLEFRVPRYTDTTVISFIFSVSDEAGNFSKSERMLRIETYSDNNTLLTELAGNNLYTNPNFHGTAFNLLNCQLLSVKNTDSKKMHIVTEIDTNNIDKMSLKWYSPAKLNFVKFNDFDYAKATQKSVKAAYDAGSKIDFITNIAINDIYLTEVYSGTTPYYMAIRITNIYDNAGSENDMFVFNVKK